jgi:beta-glucosidase
MLLNVKKLYGDIPIYVMENGASYPDKISPDSKIHDQDRVNYYRIYIQSLHNAIQQGVDVRGYFAWSLMDNFEWEEGYSSRFGIVYIDFETQIRIVKDSGNFYTNVIAENGLEGED